MAQIPFQRALRDHHKLRLWIMQHSTSIKAWGSFIALIVFIFFVFSDGDFSFLLTLSSVIGLFSFVMVTAMIEKTKSASGVSSRMMECYVVLLLARLVSIIPFEGYLPFDRTGDWMYQLSEVLSFCMAGSIVYLCRVRYSTTYDVSMDSLSPIYLIVPIAILSIIFHPSLNGFMPADICWTFALYLESVASLCQLLMFQKEKKVEPFTTHFLAAQAFSKAMSFAFWISTYKELNDTSRPLKSYVGVWVIVMQFVQLVVMGDFIYHYARCLSKGISPQYILTEAV